MEEPLPLLLVAGLQGWERAGHVTQTPSMRGTVIPALGNSWVGEGDTSLEALLNV